MRFFVVVLFSLASCLGTAAAQSVSSVEASAVQAVSQPDATTTDVTPAEPVEQPAAKSDEKPLTTLTDEQAAILEQPAAQPEQQAAAQTCPGNPDAIGTSRTITIEPAEFSRIGSMQYKQELPLKDHEVVLTFDDGPIPPYTNSILETLAENCVRATYFMVGDMARNYPHLVRRVYNGGHSIGTHTQHHPYAMQRLSMQRVESEVDGGIASVDAALGDPKAISPFFRIPGLGRTGAIEHYLADKKLVTWSADVDTNDWWRGTSPGAIVQRAMRRLNAKGRGILLMHDIHPATVLALPTLLKELKAGGYRVVHVEASGERPKLLPELETLMTDHGAWPRVARSAPVKTKPAAEAPHRIKKLVATRHYRSRTAKLPVAGNTAVAPQTQIPN